MSYTPTKATRKAAKPAKVQSLYGYAMSYTPTKASAKADTQADIERMRRIWTDRFESKDTSAKADTQADVDRMRRIWTGPGLTDIGSDVKAGSQGPALTWGGSASPRTGMRQSRGPARGPVRTSAKRSAAVVGRETRLRHQRYFTGETRLGERVSPHRAEREGFEPSTSLTTRNGFRDRRIRPLCHLSVRRTA